MPTLRSLLACPFLILPGTVWAQTGASSLELDWRVPRACPQAASVHADVMRLVGATVESGPRLVAHGAVLEEAAHRWALTLRTVVDGVSGERVLVGQSCRAVTDAAVITLALTLNPDLAVPDSDSESLSPPTRAPEQTASGLPPGAGHNDSTDHREEIHWLLGSLVGLRWGLLQRPIEEYGLGIGISPGRMQAWLEGGFSSDTVSSSKPGGYADFWFVSLRCMGCYLVADGALDLLPCGGLDWTRVRGRTAGFDNSAQGFDFVELIGLRSQVSLALSPRLAALST